MKRKNNKKMLPLAYVLACILLLGVGIACLLSGVKSPEDAVAALPPKNSASADGSNTDASKAEKDAGEETASANTQETVNTASPEAVRPLSEDEKYALEHPEEVRETETETKDTFLAAMKGEDRLPDGVADLMTSFLDNYFSTQQSFPARFKTLEDLEIADQTVWFADPNSLQAGIWQHAVLYECAAKTANDYDFSLDSCSYWLEIGKVTEQEDGNLKVEYEESCELGFHYLKGIITRQQGLNCEMVLQETASGWRIVSYYREEDFYSAINTYVNDDTTVEDLDRLCTNAFQRYCKNYLAMMKSKKAANAGELTYDEAAHSYDREAAAAYISLYWEKRNPDYTAYDGMGGNYQNFASQMLRAGGIPMDVSGMSRWKYYGDTWDDSANYSGRTGSWIGASDFHTYAKENTGYGLYAIVDFSPFGAEPGDIFQVGARSDSIGHSNVVLGPYEEDGEIVDILLNSNSNNRENWPMTATFSSRISLIKICGWND